VCVCEKEKKNVKGEKMGSFEKLWGDNPLGPKKNFHLRQTCAISVALWSFHANSAQYANGVRFQDQFFKVFYFCFLCLCTTTICNKHKNTYKTGCTSQKELVLRHELDAF
jgi:hypothetical protein